MGKAGDSPGGWGGHLSTKHPNASFVLKAVGSHRRLVSRAVTCLYTELEPQVRKVGQLKLSEPWGQGLQARGRIPLIQIEIPSHHFLALALSSHFRLSLSIPVYEMGILLGHV